MTPEQIERLKRVAEAFAEQTPDLAADIRALLAEWEDRGQEIERLETKLAEVQDEDGTHGWEVASLTDRLSACTEDYIKERNAATSAEAKLAKVVEILSRDYSPVIQEALAAARGE